LPGKPEKAPVSVTAVRRAVRAGGGGSSVRVPLIGPGALSTTQVMIQVYIPTTTPRILQTFYFIFINAYSLRALWGTNASSAQPLTTYTSRKSDGISLQINARDTAQNSP